MTSEEITVKDVTTTADLPGRYIMFYDDLGRAVDWLNRSQDVMDLNKIVLRVPIRAFRYDHILAFELENTDEMDRSERDSVRDGAEGETEPQPR